MNALPIDPGNVPARAPKPDAGAIPREKYFTFTLKHWKEQKYFGVGSKNNSWFSSLLSRLRDLSKEKVARFFDDAKYQRCLRYHAVDWDMRATPLTRDQLGWIPKDIRDNETEFPIYQIHISKGCGRIHGFWDTDYCFNIILLDPLHNLQPSKVVAYNVRPTSLSSCEYSALRIAIDKLIDKGCPDRNCKLGHELRVLGDRPLTDEENVIIAGITSEAAIQLQKLRMNKLVSISDIVEFGITFYNE